MSTPIPERLAREELALMRVALARSQALDREIVSGAPGGLRPPHPPFTLDRSEGQEDPGLKSGQPSTEPS